MKNFINKILDMPKLVRRIWLLLWILLVILLVMKFCFGIWYPIVSNNKIFNNVCSFIDDNRIIYNGIGLILYIFSVNIITLSCLNKKKYDNWIMLLIMNVIIISMFFIKNYFAMIGNILEIVYMTLFFVIINIKQNNFKSRLFNIIVPILIYILINLWQLSIYLVRGLNIQELKLYPSLVVLLLQLDYYVFLNFNLDWSEFHEYF